MNIISNARGLSVKSKALTGAALVGGLLVGGVALGGAANAASDTGPTDTAVVSDVATPIPGATPTDRYWGDQKIDSIAIIQNPDGTCTTELYVDGELVGSVTGPAPAQFPTTPQTGGGDPSIPAQP